MMPGPRAPFRGGMPPQAFRNQMPRSPMGPMGGPQGLRGPSPFSPMGRGIRGPGGPPQMRQGPGGGGGGGLLSKLLGRGNQSRGMGAGALQSASRAAGTGGTGGILNAISNPGAITGFLENTQKVLNTAQQFGPMIQQYGPLVKNIPAMWKLYRGLKSSTDDTDEKVQENKKPAKAKQAGKQAKKKKKEGTDDQPVIQSEKKSEFGTSKPKLYV